ncbi:hypothetical protein GCM10020254_76300 [Streptomyces goshikiensis]
MSSFGAGGANAHVVLEEYRPAAAPRALPPGGDQLFTLSARSPELLARYAGEVAAALTAPSAAGAGLSELAYTSQVGRPEFRSRVAVLCGSVPELAERLTAFSRGESGPGVWQGNAAAGREATVAGGALRRAGRRHGR